MGNGTKAGSSSGHEATQKSGIGFSKIETVSGVGAWGSERKTAENITFSQGGSPLGVFPVCTEPRPVSPPVGVMRARGGAERRGGAKRRHQ